MDGAESRDQCSSNGNNNKSDSNDSSGSSTVKSDRQGLNILDLVNSPVSDSSSASVRSAVPVWLAQIAVTSASSKHKSAWTRVAAIVTNALAAALSSPSHHHHHHHHRHRQNTSSSSLSSAAGAGGGGDREKVGATSALPIKADDINEYKDSPETENENENESKIGTGLAKGRGGEEAVWNEKDDPDGLLIATDWLRAFDVAIKVAVANDVVTNSNNNNDSNGGGSGSPQSIVVTWTPPLPAVTLLLALRRGSVMVSEASVDALARAATAATAGGVTLITPAAATTTSAAIAGGAGGGATSIEAKVEEGSHTSLLLHRLERLRQKLKTMHQRHKGKQTQIMDTLDLAVAVSVAACGWPGR